ncbi:MAG TPA: type III-A CRISPR-associated protein Cas10/Csm1 [Candidatus Competibacteraceae bacterium]|nr:type III-A CRISPR-associated protein Cas10/Csm1 [Candidatus Competibacteraceae bacterium]
MEERKLLFASCRMALAALLHDFGKFAERARIEAAEQKDSDGISRRDMNVQLYCPHFDGRPTHIHAAYTGIAFDLVERHFPELIGDDMTPFAPWKDKNADDSLINAAAKHHRPETFLQWVIATADRMASGFEREEFEQYNASADETDTKKNHYTARQLALFEQIRLDGGAGTARPAWRYPLKPLSPTGIFPVQAQGYETDDKTAAQREYRALWEQFVKALEDIPRSHRANLALWLDHFESLWQCFTQAIPAATAFNVKPEVSLYDHSKTTAALAVALWRYHHERADNPDEVRRAMKERTDWDEPKLLLVQGDFSGIQDFIFATGGETQRRAAKLLRGRSFYVSLLTECAALKVLDELSLPPTSQVINAAGKFLIVAPNTEVTKAALARVQDELNAWFLAHTYGQSGIGLAWLPACCNDFLHGKGDKSPFRELMKRLFEQLEEAKLRRFGLCAGSPAPAVFEGFLNAFDADKGECDIDGRSPATRRLEGERDIWVSALAYDQVMTGKWLATYQRILVTRQNLNHNTLELPLFGYHVSFTRDEDITGKFGREAESGNLLRTWDFSLPEPEEADTPLWNGYARRYINAFVPRFGDLTSYDKELYEGLELPEGREEIKTLNHLARDDRRRDEGGRLIGVEALMTLKGDVDNLGLIFQKGLGRPTFAKMAALSRQMNAFFAIWLPWVCRKEFPNTYTVFAGGDDFFLIGPWHSTIRLARRMRQEFARYTAENADIHFSAGLSMTKPGLPIRHLGRLAEEALDEAKTHNPGNVAPAPKNAVTCYGKAVTWDEFEALMQREEALGRLAAELGLSTGYLYDLLAYTDMAAKVSERPENALWHSRFAYRTRRMLEAKIKGGEDPRAAEQKRRRLQAELAAEIAHSGIERFGAAYKITLFTHLYQQRD